MSIGIFIDIKGTEEVRKKLKRVDDNVRKVMEKVLIGIVVDIQSVAIKSIQKLSPGKRVGGHVTSKPGAPPNTDTGRLVQSIGFNINKATLTAVVGTGIKYGTFLEFGTSKMKARPWLGPAKNKVRKKSIGKFVPRLRKP